MKLRIAVAAIVAAACLVPVAASAQTARAINFDKQKGPVTLTGDGATVLLQPKVDGGQLDLTATITIAGFKPLTVTQSEIVSWGGTWVAIGKLSKTDTAPSVLIEGFTGGAHCCATLKVVIPVGGELKVVDFTAIDGDTDKTFPKDLDGDGVFDFWRQDDSFRYQFASSASSFSPPVFYNIVDGKLVDVSTSPKFRPQWETFARETQKACAAGGTDQNGACAAFVAASARLGRFDTAMPQAVKWSDPKSDFWPDRCTVALVDSVCPEGKNFKFGSFDEALRWFLKEHKYID